MLKFESFYWFKANYTHNWQSQVFYLYYYNSKNKYSIKIQSYENMHLNNLQTWLTRCTHWKSFHLLNNFFLSKYISQLNLICQYRESPSFIIRTLFFKVILIFIIFPSINLLLLYDTVTAVFFQSDLVILFGFANMPQYFIANVNSMPWLLGSILVFAFDLDISKYLMDKLN